MACKYCAEYIRLAFTEVPGFEAACTVIGMNPKNPADYERIFDALAGIGQFGTIRLARAFPSVTDEEQFRTVAKAGLHFYWMVLDFWADQRKKEAAAKLQAAQKAKSAAKAA